MNVYGNVVMIACCILRMPCLWAELLFCARCWKLWTHNHIHEQWGEKRKIVHNHK